MLLLYPEYYEYNQRYEPNMLILNLWHQQGHVPPLLLIRTFENWVLHPSQPLPGNFNYFTNPPPEPQMSIWVLVGLWWHTTNLSPVGGKQITWSQIHPNRSPCTIRLCEYRDIASDLEDRGRLLISSVHKSPRPLSVRQLGKGHLWLHSINTEFHFPNILILVWKKIYDRPI